MEKPSSRKVPRNKIIGKNMKSKMKIYSPRASVIRGVEKQHTNRTLFDLDAGSTLTWKSDGTNSTAHWTISGGRHHIVINKEMVNLIDHPDMLAKIPHRRKELQYLRSVHNHEVAHGLYTSRDFVGINKICKKFDIPFRDVNLFEDARIESLFRQRRPHKVSGKCDLDHLGNPTKPDTYGVRKFEWCKWEGFNLDTARNCLLAFIKCEGTKKNHDMLHDIWMDKFGSGGGPTSTKGTYGFSNFLGLWREIAGRGCDKRYPTTESLLGLIRKFNKLFPHDPTEDETNINGIGGNDFVDSCTASGETPHGSSTAAGGEGESEPEREVKSTTETVRGVVDEKYGGRDESQDKVTKETLVENGLDPAYFAWEA